MAIVNKFNVNNKQVTLDADIIENMSANDVSYNSSLQYDENTVGDKLSELEKEVIYDVTTNNNGITFSSLSELLSSENLSTLIPLSVRCGGMSIRFVQSSDNKYIQARCMTQKFSTDVTQWQGVDDEPTTNSKNLVISGGVFPMFNAINKALIPITGNISIIGDSISTFKGTMPSGYVTYYPQSPLGITSLYDMWWHLLLSMTNSKLEVNASWSGSRVTSTLQNVPDFYDRTNILGSPDYIFVELGTNDSTYSVALGDYDYDTEDLSETAFIPAYIKGVKSLKTNYPNAKIVLFVFQMTDSYANAIKNIGKHYELDVIDVRSYYVNNVHPNKLQMCSVAQTIRSFYIKGIVDDEPTVNSNNLVKSGGVCTDINSVRQCLFLSVKNSTSIIKGQIKEAGVFNAHNDFRVYIIQVSAGDYVHIIGQTGYTVEYAIYSSFNGSTLNENDVVELGEYHVGNRDFDKIVEVSHSGYFAMCSYKNATIEDILILSSLSEMKKYVDFHEDISANNNGTEYASLDLALAAIKIADRKSGMSIRYIDANTHKYVQYRYNLVYANTTAGNKDFLNTENWFAGMPESDEKPTAGSKKLVTSKGIYPLVSNNLCGKNITIIGDDLSTFDSYTSTKYYPNSGSGVNFIEQTWWYNLILKNNAILKENLSANLLRITNGASVTNNLVAKVESAQDTDVMFLAAGAIDGIYSIPLGVIDFTKSTEDLDDSKIVDAYIHAIRIAITKATKVYCVIQSHANVSIKEAIIKIAEYYKGNGVETINLYGKELEEYDGINNIKYRLTLNGMSQMGSIIQDCISSEAMSYVSLADKLGYNVVDVDAKDFKWENDKRVRKLTNQITTSTGTNSRLSAYVKVVPGTVVYVAGRPQDISDTYRIAAFDEYFNILPEDCRDADFNTGRIKYVVPSGVHYILVSTTEQHKPESGVFSQPFNFANAFDCQNADNIVSYLKSQNIKQVQGYVPINYSTPGIFRDETSSITLFPVFFKKENIYKIRFDGVGAGLLQLVCFTEDGSTIQTFTSNTDSGMIEVNENAYVFAIQLKQGNIEDINLKFFYKDTNLFQKRYCDVNAVRDAVVISDWEHEKMAHVCQLFFDYDTKFFFVPYYSSMGNHDADGEKNIVVSKISPCALNKPTFFKPFEYGMTVGTFTASPKAKFNDPNIIFLSDGATARCLVFGGNANPEVQGQETGYFYRDFNKETLSLGNSVNICKLKYRYNGEDVVVNMTVANVTEFATRIMNKPTGPGGTLIMSPEHLVTTENEQTVIYSYLSGITSGIDGDWDGCIIKSTDYGVTWEYVSHRPNTEYLGMWEVGLALVGRRIFVLYKASKYPISYYDLDNDEWGDIVLQSYTGAVLGIDSSRPLLYYNNNVLYAITNIPPRINDKGEITYAGSGTPNSVYRSHVLIEKIDTTTIERTFFKEFWHHDSCQYFSTLNVYGWDYFAFTEDRRRQTTANSIKGNISMLKVDWFQQDIENSYQENIFNQ